VGLNIFSELLLWDVRMLSFWLLSIMCFLHKTKKMKIYNYIITNENKITIIFIFYFYFYFYFLRCYHY
ncbi:MAG: hypothetical protein K6253_01315, partial [Candidatus Liberibacter asiaticus]|nr:hypothetical protein [Candidatus Liberibacter asiaticus]